MSGSDGSKTQRLPRRSTKTATGRSPSLLPENEAFLEGVIDNLPVAIFAKDASDEFRFVLWNKKQEQITTIPKEKALGRTDLQIFSKESAEYFREVDESVIRRGKLIDVPEEIVDTGAGEVWLHTVKVPIDDKVMERKLVVGISEDITERVRAREQLERLNRNLTEKNKELEVTQLQLIQAEKMESVGRLAAGVAHEVKNPLALLLMGVEYLSTGIDPNDPNIEEILSEMREAINRADKIIRGLVDFSSERQLALEPTELPPLIEQSLLLVRHELTKNGVNVDIEFEKELPKVMVDGAKFEQVLVNLFINAIHAMAKSDRPKLEVLVYSEKLDQVPRDEGARTAHHLRSGDEVVILEVKDNGCGISEANLRKIFDPFFTTKATGLGTGLGLSVVSKIVELHGGAIRIRNRLLGGVTVRIMLKVTKTKEAD
ncbi:MAG: PAS domain-containing protein [Verrucomicrobiae bacterium]|nr:PAS domain-containing protein [Verrucomicrobiae bacterium]